MILYKIIVLLHTVYMTSTYEHNHYHDYEEEYENTLFDEEFTKNDEAVTKKPKGYEVTEMVDDIPDNRTKGTIIPNYTIKRNLNTVPTSATTASTDKEDEIRKNDNKKTKEDSETFLPIITDYLVGFKKGLVNGFNNIFQKRHYEDDFDSDPDTSFSYTDKIHKPISSFVRKFHSALAGRRDGIF
ncbi:unnamed protein product [Euphydryas editha]|uniref:Uncharacterized protein n=1 Tax=Euphydryas editha TaxID=104508 RepID=A0AAU9U5E3_EUPED|nr:unnamed protein product [Euphydryas editha]